VSDLCLGIAAFVRRSCELDIGSGEANTRDVLVIDDLRSHVDSAWKVRKIARTEEG
jgi:hypothetical protein